MKKLFLIQLFLFILQYNVVLSQSSCVNIGFEEGNSHNWQGQKGTTNGKTINLDPIENNFTFGKYINGVLQGDSRRVIMENGKAPVYDNIVQNNGLKCVPDGHKYSVRLGNSSTGKEVDRLIYQMNVDREDLLFIWKFAVVLQDPEDDNHYEYERPKFSLYIKDADGNLIEECAKYEVTADGTIEGFNNQGKVRWRDWTTVGLNLKDYYNKTIRIEIETRDCSLGGHYGYGYFVAQCQSMNINVTYCDGNASAVLEAPEGFANYTWSTGQTGRTITVSNPQEGQKYLCTLKSVTGCMATLEATVKKTTITPDFTYELTNCASKTFKFTNKSKVNVGTLSDYTWSFGDAASSTLKDPSHNYTSSFTSGGDANVRLTVKHQGCTVYITKPVAVPPNLPSSVSINSFPEMLCSGAILSVEPTFGSTASNVEYRWMYRGENETTWETISTAPKLNIPDVDVSNTGYYQLQVNPWRFYHSTCIVKTTPKFMTVKDCPCINCPSSFAPIPGKKYIISAWVKEADKVSAASYSESSVSVLFDVMGINAVEERTFKPSGAIIDGWQRIQEEFEVPGNAYKIRIRLNNNSSSDQVFFDDVRVFPSDGSMKSYAYDPETLRLAGELDEENYATFYEYDEEGSLVRIKKETEKGVMTIREARQAKPKKSNSQNP